MSRKVNEEYKVLALINAQTMTGTVTGAAVAVEGYMDDAIVVPTVANFYGAPTVTITITGSLTGTPNTYDQTLATFTAATAGGIAAASINLNNIANVKGVATFAGGASPTVCIGIVLLARLFAKATATNSVTLA